MMRQPIDTDAPRPAAAPGESPPPNQKPLTDAARRALAEAEARRAAYEAAAADLARTKEVNGPKGPEPVRYGDWESKGIASDF